MANSERRFPRFPIPVKFHKKSVQLELDLQLPFEEEVAGKWAVTPGCIWLSIAKAKDSAGRSMDWENKLTFKMGSVDIRKILDGLPNLDRHTAQWVTKKRESEAAGQQFSAKRPLIDLLHDPSKPKRASTGGKIPKVSTLQVECGEKWGTYRWTLTVGKGQERDYRSVFLSRDEMVHIKVLLEAALARIPAWAA